MQKTDSVKQPKNTQKPKEKLAQMLRNNLKRRKKIKPLTKKTKVIKILKAKKCFLSQVGLLLVAAWLQACAVGVEENGYFFDVDEVKESIIPNKTSEKEVIKKFGTPTTFSTLDGRVFYYMARKYEKKAFLRPGLLNQLVLAVSFDKNHIVSKVKIYTKKDARQIIYDRSKTEFSGNEMKVLEQLFSNVGKFSTQSARKIK